MTTLTQMERTTTGWTCSRCGATQEDTILPVRVVECNCIGLGAFHARLRRERLMGIAALGVVVLALLACLIFGAGVTAGVWR